MTKPLHLAVDHSKAAAVRVSFPVQGPCWPFPKDMYEWGKPGLQMIQENYYEEPSLVWKDLSLWEPTKTGVF